ncbi:MAG TPA: type II toxin-antitoxin system RelE/ParE family toxin [Anaerolineae bacterium]|nr:type II toxin-antitoxin system RelE/ParE family toxin [Anaerolineae bacterium]
MPKDDQSLGNEPESITTGLAEIARGEVVFQHPHAASAALLDLWQLGEPPIGDHTDLILREAPDTGGYGVRYRWFRRPPVPPSWDLGFTSEFSKAIANIDRKLQGRVLQALDYISSKPTVPRGNTVKPLSGEYEGLWRYRIGDYRLIYRPDTDNARVVLITVVSRGSAYA